MQAGTREKPEFLMQTAEFMNGYALTRHIYYPDLERMKNAEKFLLNDFIDSSQFLVDIKGLKLDMDKFEDWATDRKDGRKINWYTNDIIVTEVNRKDFKAKIALVRPENTKSITESQNLEIVFDFREGTRSVEEADAFLSFIDEILVKQQSLYRIKEASDQLAELNKRKDAIELKAEREIDDANDEKSRNFFKNRKVNEKIDELKKNEANELKEIEPKIEEIKAKIANLASGSEQFVPLITNRLGTNEIEGLNLTPMTLAEGAKVPERLLVEAQRNTKG